MYIIKRKVGDLMKVGYIRVSTLEQNDARQKEALKTHDIERYFTEKISAKNTKRPKLQEMLEFVRSGDTIFVLDFSRLARSTRDLLDIVELLERKNVHLVSLKENMDTSTATGKLLLTMIAAINEFERSNLLERQKEGIAIAKAEGKYKGRQVVEIKDFPSHYERYMGREVTKAKLAKQLRISRPTLDRMIVKHEESLK